LRGREEKHASRNGFVSGMNCLPHLTIALRRLIIFLRLIGRQAPVKRCLARFAKLSFRIFFAGRLMPRPTIKESLYP
jgi:hypothetical protein